MRRLSGVVWVCLVLVLLTSCKIPQAKSRYCFDEIRGMVEGKTAAEVETLLGKPDSRQSMRLSGERWVWWNYTYLEGADYPPEKRGQVVHLEILFERIGEALGNSAASLSDLRTSDPLSVSYTIPRGKS